ncbi:hypothetical protein B0J13DRAFT_144635 [Dactylonectria estremocensis]|uniref:Secreted protein n=1 Tax=Dactylonectria estremocensis TaxID=1079267 RepID=A0A9P9DXG1_9HYPO|nr:hypothetical protein B0J13DRAFT_144635 [Dactylonectria estremocensis]
MLNLVCLSILDSIHASSVTLDHIVPRSCRFIGRKSAYLLSAESVRADSSEGMETITRVPFQYSPKTALRG